MFAAAFFYMFAEAFSTFFAERIKRDSKLCSSLSHYQYYSLHVANAQVRHITFFEELLFLMWERSR
jgi:hypothetical protein